MANPDITRHGTDPDWTRREIAKAEARDADALKRFGEMNARRLAASYRSAADRALNLLFGAALAVLALWILYLGVDTYLDVRRNFAEDVAR